MLDEEYTIKVEKVYKRIMSVRELNAFAIKPEMFQGTGSKIDSVCIKILGPSGTKIAEVYLDEGNKV